MSDFYYTEKDSPERLGFDLDEFAKDYDPYDYNDSISNDLEWMDHIRATIRMLTNKEIKPIVDWLTEILEEEDDEEAKELLKRVEVFG